MGSPWGLHYRWGSRIFSWSGCKVDVLVGERDHIGLITRRLGCDEDIGGSGIQLGSIEQIRGKKKSIKAIIAVCMVLICFMLSH